MTMNVKFKYQKAAKPEPIYIEQVYAEKPGGGVVANPSFDAPPTTAVGEQNGKFVLIKGYRLVKAVASGDSTIEIAKGSGIKNGDVIAHGKKGVACTAVDTTTHPDKDVVTVSLALDIPIGTVLYQAKAASSNAAVPFLPPSYVTGTKVDANEGDQSVRLINGANLRKETANIANEVAELLPTIKLV